MGSKALVFLLVTVWASVLAPQAWGHCQIPCGIYNDSARFTLMLEHVSTIEKSMDQIKKLSNAESPNCNQLVRWISNKEAHADELTEIVTFYFMAQRVKPAKPQDRAAYEKYVKEVTLLHQMIVNAMKAKQSVDLAYCHKLRELIDHFRRSYLGEESQHEKGHSH